MIVERSTRLWFEMKIFRFLCLICFFLAASQSLSAQDASTGNGHEAAPSPQSSAQLTLDDLRTFTDVFNQLRKNYVEEVNDKTLLQAAINGMLAELDPHSAYLPNQDFEDLENSARGQYIGLGIDVAAENGKVVVKRVISPSPADTAGIDPGDFITAIDKQPVKGQPFQEVLKQLQGEPGTSVELTVTRPGEKSKALTLKREYVKLPALSYRLLENRFAYVRIVYFHRDSANDLKSTLESVQQAGTQLQGLILDLRNNPGGVLQPAIDMADGFLDEGIIVSTRGRDETMQMQISASHGQWVPDMPLVLLVDRGTASASEVLAGALQDNGRAVIVGERTFGKGSVQSVLPLRNGAGIKLTTARYYTPSGKSIQAQGIVPDVLVAGSVKIVKLDDDRKLEADLKRHLDNKTEPAAPDSGETVSVEEDYPLYEALNLLRASHILSSG
jgi:carboxyl-terminal processing protease